MRWNKRFIFLGLTALLLLSCGQKGPQSPSQRMGESPKPDSAQLALMEFNRQMAETADKALGQLVKAQEEPYALYEGSTWVTILEHGDIDNPQPKRGEEWIVHMRIYALDGRLLEDSKGTYTIGKLELPYAVDANITEWHRHCHIRMYAPWYSAFGMKGTEEIPPYENVIIELDLE